MHSSSLNDQSLLPLSNMAVWLYLAKIKLGWECLSVTYAQTYNMTLLLIAVIKKSFEVQRYWFYQPQDGITNP